MEKIVHNRATKIRDLVQVANWSHCPWKDNPADLPSRGISTVELQFSKIWLHGPTWLTTISPKPLNKEMNMPDECVSELKGKDCTISHSFIVSITNPTI